MINRQSYDSKWSTSTIWSGEREKEKKIRFTWNSRLTAATGYSLLLRAFPERRKLVLIAFKRNSLMIIACSGVTVYIADVFVRFHLQRRDYKRPFECCSAILLVNQNHFVYSIQSVSFFFLIFIICQCKCQTFFFRRIQLSDKKRQQQQYNIFAFKFRAEHSAYVWLKILFELRCECALKTSLAVNCTRKILYFFRLNYVHIRTTHAQTARSYFRLACLSLSLWIFFYTQLYHPEKVIINNDETE